jgi:hypothetical protein
MFPQDQDVPEAVDSKQTHTLGQKNNALKTALVIISMKVLLHQYTSYPNTMHYITSCYNKAENFAK